MDEVSASSGYVPIGSVSAAVEGVGNRPPGAPSKRPQYFAALAGKVFRPTEWFVASLTFVKPKLFADMLLSFEFLDLPDPDLSFSVWIRILSSSS